MAGRGRCWVCGGLLVHGRGVCDSCIESLGGWCSRCQHRDACRQLYAAAAERRRRVGLQPPSYPLHSHDNARVERKQALIKDLLHRCACSGMLLIG
jgi:hypothetical protein